MIQEIIHNTLKHAKASELKIELKCSKQTLIILTEDNGRGFDYVRQSVENKGLGLRNLLSRTEVLGGDMYIDSKQNKGTKYTFEIPL
jgi:signal transduction histidine kinase